ncbi:glutamate receptor ionotropic, delta-2-like [Cydia splendana]|uniref:glutamate receptor ionotropic, delta-2-like n=1 Tax=Cydia splendana TaxID=1100963 RepID=UPI00213299C3
MITPSILFPIEILLNILINEHLQESFCLTFVTETKFTVNIPTNMSSMIIQPNNSILVEQILDASEKGCSDYIVQMHEPENFMKAFEKVNHLGDVRRSGKKLIFLPSQDEMFNKSDLTNILTLTETGFVANILLIVPSLQSSDCKVYDMITHTFVGSDEEVHKPLYLDRWDSCTSHFERGVNLFPHDMSNLYGKTVKVAAFTYKPYVLLDLDPSLNPLGRDGMEMRIIDEFCRWVNCTVEIVRDDEHEWGEIYENNTGVGVLGNVVEDRADIGITALYSWYEVYRVLDFSAPIIRTAITCIAPAPRILTSWDLPLVPFTWTMWMCIVFTFFYASLALSVAQRSTKNVFLDTFGMMITQTREDATSWRIRSITGWMLVTGLVIDNAYSGGLASSFTVPKYEASIDTVEDLVDRKMEWGATHDAWIFSIMLSEEPLIKSLLNQFKTYPADILKRKSFSRSMAFSIEHLPAGYFAIGEYITKEAAMDLEIMLDKIYYEQCVVMLRKSSPYTAKLSELVGRLHQSGLMLSWETQVALKYLDFKVQLEVRLSRARKDLEGIEPLSIKQLLGIYIFYFGGVVIALLGFFGELLSKCSKPSIVL